MSAQRPPAVPPPSAPDLRVAVVVSRYHSDITDRLLKGARQAWGESGGNPENLEVFSSPGAFELPILAMHAANCRAFDAVVALGCILKGETSHDRVLADAVTQGLTQASLLTGLPITLGVITADTKEQALARAGGAEGNKGAEALRAAIACAATVFATSEAGENAFPLDIEGMFESDEEREEAMKLMERFQSRIESLPQARRERRR